MLFLFFSIFVNAQLQIEIGQTYEGIIATSRGDLSQKVFILQADNDLEPKDLILMTNSLGPYGKPIIAVFSEQVQPFHYEYADVLQCTSDGIDICAIPYDQIIRNHTYYIVLFCERYCNYQFKTIYQSELQMKLNDTLQFRFNDQQESEYITIHTEYRLTYYDTLEILIKILNFNELESPFHSYLNLNLVLPSTEVYEKKGQDTWNGVQIITVNSDEYYFNPTFKLLVVSQSGSIVQIETKIYLYLRSIKLFEEIEGIIYQNEIKYYKLNLTDESELELYEQKEIEFEVTPYMGHVNLFIHNGNQPTLLNQYKWNSSNSNGTDILISQKQEISKEYYLAILGVDSVSSYQLIVSLANENEINLDFNKRKSGTINYQEAMNFHLNFYLKKQEETTLYINLYVKFGFINMIINNCIKEQQCNIDNALSVNPQDKNIIQLNQQKQEIYQLNVTSKDCKFQHTVYYCSYNLGLYPNPLSSFSDHYYMIEVSKLEDIKLLRENTPLKSFVKQDQYQFYKILIKNSQQNLEVRKLQFILTPIQGDAVMYLSLKETKPTNTSDYLSKSSNNLLNFGENGDLVQEGIYFLGVQGITSCLYTITANLIRSGEDMYTKGIYPWHYIQLYEGDLHRSQIQISEESLFKIDLHSYTQDPSLFENRKVFVQLEQEMGKFEILGFDHPEKDPTKFQWRGKKELIIQSSDPLYPEVLFIKVRPIGQFSQHRFNIFYSIGNNPKQLIIGQPYYGFIQKESSQDFWLQYYKQEELKIVKSSSNFDQSKLQLFLSLQEEEVMLTDQCIYRIQVNQLPLTNCSNSNLDIFTCSIKMKLYSLDDTDYILYISKNQQSTKLIESQVLTSHIPIKQDFYFFYIQDNKTQVIIQSEQTELQIFANINIISEGSDLTKYPSTDDYQIKSIPQKFQYATSLLIDYEYTNNYLCFQKVCKVTLMVERAYPFENDNMNSTYRIMYSSKYIKLNENQQFMGHLQKNQLMFFETHVPSNESTLSIIANPLSYTDLTIIVKKNQLPSLDDFDWSSVYEDQLIIEPGNIKHPDMEGDYFIGVYSYGQTNFTIQVNYQSVHFYKLSQGIPFTMIGDTNSIIYLNYQHTIDKEFTIILYSSMKNTQRYYLAQYEKQNQLNDLLLSNLTNFQQIELIEYGFTTQFNINKSNSLYKLGSYYLIAVYIHYYSQLTVIIKLKDEVIYLQPNTLLIQETEKEYLNNIKINPSTKFNITVHLYNGDIIISGGTEFPNLNAIGKLNENNEQKQFTIEADEHQPYFIQIYSQQRSYYKFIYINLENSLPLELGKPFSISFFQQREYTFHYKSIAKQEGCRFQLLIEDASELNQDAQYKYQHPIVNVRKDLMENQDYLYSPHKFEQQFVIEEYQTDIYQSLEYYDTRGLYFIEITFVNQHQERQNHIIITLTNTENSLRSLTTFKSNIIQSKAGQSKLWEIYINHPSQIFIIGQMCGGFIEMYGSNNLSELEIEQYQQKINHIQHKQLMGSFYVDQQGIFYIKSKLIRMKNNHINNSIYTITPYILNNDTKINYNSLEPGNEGSYYFDYGSDQLKVVFQQIKWIQKDKDAFQINQIIYYLIYEIVDYFEDYQINLCTINKQYFQNITIKGQQTDIYERISQQISLDQDKQVKLMFTILAEVEIMTNNKEIINLNYLYDTNSINQYDITYYTISKYLQYIVYLILILTLIIIVYLVIRRVQIQKNLQAQKQDQRADQLVPEGAEMSNI